MKSKQNNEVFLDILVNTTAVPNILLEYYKEFRLSEGEVLFVINLLRLKANGLDLTCDSVKENSNYSAEEIANFLPSLIEKDFIALNKKGAFNLKGLFERLREAWGWKEAKVQNIASQKELVGEVDKEFSAIYLKFQEEMGRPLSTIEGEQIKDWFSKLGMNGELIYEALKKAVLLDKRNFQYINKILLDWQSKNYKNLTDLLKEGQNNTKNRKQASSNKKYRQDQDADIFNDDVFKVN